MGEDFATRIDTLTKYPWIKLTNRSAPNTNIQKRIDCYKLIKKPIKQDFNNKKYFYYQITKYFTNKIEYMRWSQAWMCYANPV